MPFHFINFDEWSCMHLLMHVCMYMYLASIIYSIQCIHSIYMYKRWHYLQLYVHFFYTLIPVTEIEIRRYVHCVLSKSLYSCHNIYLATWRDRYVPAWYMYHSVCYNVMILVVFTIYIKYILMLHTKQNGLECDVPTKSYFLWVIVFL